MSGPFTELVNCTNCLHCKYWHSGDISNEPLAHAHGQLFNIFYHYEKKKKKKAYSVGFTYLKKKTHLSKTYSTVKFVSIDLIR